MAGVGIELLSLKPRIHAWGANGDQYKIDERITTLSYEAHAKYTHKAWFIAAKSVLGSNLTQASGLGGFGIKSVDGHTGKQKYTPIRFSSSWLNVVYGQKWKPGIFVGYAKNLGTSDALYAPDGTDAQVYGTGTNLDQLVTAGAELTYNVPHWKFGLEYTLSSAWYGSLNASNGKSEILMPYATTALLLLPCSCSNLSLHNSFDYISVTCHRLLPNDLIIND